MSRIVKGRVKCPDVKCWREGLPADYPNADGVGDPKTDLKRVVIHHSPTGHNWGYGGSGPADLALDILATCLPLGCDGAPPTRCFDGQCSETAWLLHQECKVRFVVPVPVAGGVIEGAAVDLWLDGALNALSPVELEDGDIFVDPDEMDPERSW